MRSGALLDERGVEARSNAVSLGVRRGSVFTSNPRMRLFGTTGDRRRVDGEEARPPDPSISASCSGKRN